MLLDAGPRALMHRVRSCPWTRASKQNAPNQSIHDWC